LCDGAGIFGDFLHPIYISASRAQPIRVGGDLISPATSVRDLGIYLTPTPP